MVGILFLLELSQTGTIIKALWMTYGTAELSRKGAKEKKTSKREEKKNDIFI